VYRVSAIDSDLAYGSAEESDLSAGDHAIFQLESGRFFEFFLTHDGSPFTQAEVWAADPQSGRYAVAPSAIEVVDDHYRIAIPEGEFVVSVRAEGFAVLEVGPFDEESVPSQVTAELTAVAGLRGRVLIDGQPVAGARVSASPIARQTVEANGFLCLVDPFSQVDGTADDAGNFSLTIREASTWVVRAEAAGHAPAKTGPLDFDPAVGLEGIELSLTSGGSIEGRVLENGQPVAGRIVAASRGDGHPSSTRSDADGIYRFEHLVPGRWQVQRAEDDLADTGYGGDTAGIRCRTPPRWFSDRKYRSKAAFPASFSMPGGTRSAGKPLKPLRAPQTSFDLRRTEPSQGRRGGASSPSSLKSAEGRYGAQLDPRLGPRVSDDRKIAPALSVGEPPQWCAMG
jgi:hypothetical protein